jgi:N-acetylglucosaminyl-diphospho-decaprenol L-rhamnosyltransferase
MTEPPADEIAVVTVTYNSSSEIGPFLDSIRRDDAALLVVVADNDSADAAVTREISSLASARFLATGGNRGYGAAVNAAVAALPASVAYVLISNPDVIIGGGAIERLSAHLREHPDVGSVGPRVTNPDGSIYPSARNVPSLRDGIGHALFGHVWPRNPWTARYRAEYAIGERDVGWLSGSCVMVRREVFTRIDGFDEAYFMYFEDVDLGYRIAKSGWRNVYLPTASVVHTGGHSTAGESARMLRAHHDSAYRFLAKKYSAPYLAPLRGALRVGLSLRARIIAGPRR